MVVGKRILAGDLFYVLYNNVYANFFTVTESKNVRRIIGKWFSVPRIDGNYLAVVGNKKLPVYISSNSPRHTRIKIGSLTFMFA